MDFQYISDIHLEMGNKVDIPRRAPFLILAGDIGDPYSAEYVSFIDNVSHKFDRVFLISGNHEYYGHTIKETDKEIQNLASRYKNVHFLQNDVYHFPHSDVSVFGATLWTHIPGNEAYFIRSMVNDYRHIQNFSIDLCNKLHEETKTTFQMFLEIFPNRKWIVVCHHLPLLKLVNEKYWNSPINSAYASDVDCFKDEHVIAIVYGHTHIANIYGRYYCNPHGYPDELSKINLDATLTIH